MSITFFLDPNTINKVGECPIKFSAYVKGVRFVSTIGYSISPTVWDKDASEEDFQELLDNCTIAFAYICGTRGFKLTSKINGKYIFLPEAGHDRTGNETWHGIGWRHCVYWSSTSKDLYYYTYEDVGVSLSIYQDLSVKNWDKERQEYDNRYVGRIIKLEGESRSYASAVRPVSD